MFNYRQNLMCGSACTPSEYCYQASKNKNESGRSMVEMLGVLAVIGVLSVAGITGYTVAMNKHRANETINRIMKRSIMVSSQKLLGQNGSIDEFGSDGSYTITLENTGDTSTFAMKVAGVPEGVCNQIISMNWDGATISPSTCSGPTDLTFTFKNDLGKMTSVSEGSSGDEGSSGEEGSSSPVCDRPSDSEACCKLADPDAKLVEDPYAAIGNYYCCKGGIKFHDYSINYISPACCSYVEPSTDSDYEACCSYAADYSDSSMISKCWQHQGYLSGVVNRKLAYSWCWGGYGLSMESSSKYVCCYSNGLDENDNQNEDCCNSFYGSSSWDKDKNCCRGNGSCDGS